MIVNCLLPPHCVQKFTNELVGVTNRMCLKIPIRYSPGAPFDFFSGAGHNGRMKGWLGHENWGLRYCAGDNEPKRSALGCA